MKSFPLCYLGVNCDDIIASNDSKNIKFAKKMTKFEIGGQQYDKFEAVKAASREPA